MAGKTELYRGDVMYQTVHALMLILLCLTATEAQGQDAVRDLPESIAKQFEGVYRFNYLFSENAAPYLDESSHRQLLDFDRVEKDGAPRITFFNQTSKGEKRSHYSYVFYQDGNKLTFREFDGNGNFRFDCLGTYQPEKRLLECSAPRAETSTGYRFPCYQKEWPFQKADFVAALRISKPTQHFSFLRMGVRQSPGKSQT
jgi:hypothetical protein